MFPPWRVVLPFQGRVAREDRSRLATRRSQLRSIRLDVAQSRSRVRGGRTLDPGCTPGDVVAVGDRECGPEGRLPLSFIVEVKRDVGEVEPPGAADRLVVNPLDRQAVLALGVAEACAQG